MSLDFASNFPCHLEYADCPGILVLSVKLLKSCQAVGFPHGLPQSCCGDALPGADEATQTKSIPRTKLLALIIVGVLYVNIANWEQFLTDKDCD
jgi:hypothetical protein